MAVKKSGLGKGLSALIPPKENVNTAPTDALFTKTEGKDIGAYFEEIPVSKIKPNSSQPRKKFNNDELNELAESIKIAGVLQAIRVIPIDKNGSRTYELIAGERRLRASKIANKKTIPAIVETAENTDKLRDAILENIHRVDLNPIDEASAYKQMIDDYGYTQDELSKQVSKSRVYITNSMRLLKLPGKVIQNLELGQISKGHGKVLVGVKDDVKIQELATKVIVNDLSVRELEELIALNEFSSSVDTDAGLGTGVGPNTGAGIGSGAGTSTKLKPKLIAPQVEELKSKLEDYFNTDVVIKVKKNSGELTIKFATFDDLSRIAELINSDLKL
jgi:ParB family chromosome partitioning protein